METTAREAKSKANVSGAKQEEPDELRSGSDMFESEIDHDEKLSREDIKFISELGWFSAAAVAIASIAASL